MHGARHALLALLMAGSLAACSDQPRAEPDPTSSASSGKPSTQPSPSPNTEPTGDETQGSPDSPVAIDPEPAALDWREVPGPSDATVTVSGDWSLTQRETEALLDGPRAATVQAPARHRVTETLIDGEYAVVVTEDERAEQANTATIIALASGDRTVLDGSSEVPTTTGGTWALGEGTLVHATIGRGRAYCLASVDLATMSSATTWCAPRRSGFSAARITPAGTAVLSFDDQRPSCRTVGRVDTGELVAFEGVPECAGWDGALLDDGAVWSVVAKENRIEEARFYARSDDGWFDLGPGTSGSLTWCGGSAYFVRDPQRSGDPAQLLGWSPAGGLRVAYETEGRGQAFLTEPRCGGTDLTLAALTGSGDRQVTASVR